MKWLLLFTCLYLLLIFLVNLFARWLTENLQTQIALTPVLLFFPFIFLAEHLRYKVDPDKEQTLAILASSIVIITLAIYYGPSSFGYFNLAIQLCFNLAWAK